MPRRHVPKPFAPKPDEPGAPIRWAHYIAATDAAPEHVVFREGTVWSLAPKPNNVQQAVWVTPDEPLPTDHYRAVCVVFPRKGDGGVYGAPESFDRADSFTGRAARDAAYAVACIHHRNNSLTPAS